MNPTRQRDAVEGRSGYRKSHSTSALALLAGNEPRANPIKSRTMRPTKAGGLGRISESGSVVGLDAIAHAGPSKRATNDATLEPAALPLEDAKSWLNDLRSLRSSSRRRLAALRGLQQTIIRACACPGTPSLPGLFDLNLHDTLLALLARHTQALASRARSSSLPPGDELATALIPDISLAVEMLQGLCLLSRKCKAALGETWVFEILIDLLLLLRAQSPLLTPTTPTSGPKDGALEAKPVVYLVLELMCCVLVDSPDYARAFEKLNGLEAVMRVLKGSGVVKDVRMKCIEFLYFYLLPEEAAPQRAVSSSSSSSNESIFPPTPLLDAVETFTPPSVLPSRQRLDRQWSDINISFVPQTPRKPAPQNLGFSTPAAPRRTSTASASTTPGLPPVPASPEEAMPMSRLSLPAEGVKSPLLSPRVTSDQRRHSMIVERQTEITVPEAAPRQTNRPEPPEARRALPKSSSMAVDLAAAARPLRRDTTSVHLADRSRSSDLFRHPSTTATNTTSSSSSGNSIITAIHQPSVPRSGMSRSSTQPTLTILQSSPRAAPIRKISVSRRVNRSSLPSPTRPQTTPHSSSPADTVHGTSDSAPTENTSMPPPPTPARRAFPSGLTKGSLPSSPLSAARRLPSTQTKAVRSVDEKKELLGAYLGNVDALVQGVENVSFWGSVKANGGRRA